MVAHRTPRATYILDAAQPDVRAHLGQLGCELGRTGASLLKLDFLWAGAEVAEGRAGAAGVTALRRGVAALVNGFRTVQPAGVVLGCGGPAPVLSGVCDALRSGCDSVLEDTPEAGRPDGTFALGGPSMIRAQARNFTARSWLWGSTIPCDVDAVLVGPTGDFPAVSDALFEQWMTLAVMSGGPVFLADCPDGDAVDKSRRIELRDVQQRVLDDSPIPQRPWHPLEMTRRR